MGNQVAKSKATSDVVSDAVDFMLTLSPEQLIEKMVKKRDLGVIIEYLDAKGSERNHSACLAITALLSLNQETFLDKFLSANVGTKLYKLLKGKKDVTFGGHSLHSAAISALYSMALPYYEESSEDWSEEMHDVIRLLQSKHFLKCSWTTFGRHAANNPLVAMSAVNGLILSLMLSSNSSSQENDENPLERSDISNLKTGMKRVRHPMIKSLCAIVLAVLCTRGMLDESTERDIGDFVFLEKELASGITLHPAHMLFFLNSEKETPLLFSAWLCKHALIIGKKPCEKEMMDLCRLRYADLFRNTADKAKRDLFAMALDCLDLSDEIKDEIPNLDEFVPKKPENFTHFGRINQIVEYQGDLYTASADGNICCWNVNTGECVKTFRGHSGSVTCFQIVPSMKKMYSGSYDQTVRVWDLENGRCVGVYGGFSRITCLHVVNDILFVGGWDKVVVALHAQVNIKLREYWIDRGTHRSHDQRISALTSAQSVLVSASTGGNIRIWDPTTAKCLYNTTVNGMVWRIEPSSRKLFIHSGSEIAAYTLPSNSSEPEALDFRHQFRKVFRIPNTRWFTLSKNYLYTASTTDLLHSYSINSGVYESTMRERVGAPITAMHLGTEGRLYINRGFTVAFVQTSDSTRVETKEGWKQLNFDTMIQQSGPLYEAITRLQSMGFTMPEIVEVIGQQNIQLLLSGKAELSTDDIDLPSIIDRLFMLRKESRISAAPEDVIPAASSKVDDESIKLGIRFSSQPSPRSYQAIYTPADYEKPLEERVEIFRSQLKRQVQVSSDPQRVLISREQVYQSMKGTLLYANTEELQTPIIFTFHGEEGIDVGGISREVYGIVSQKIMNSTLFKMVSEGGGAYPDPIQNSEAMLDDYRCIGRIVGKALFDGYHMDLPLALPMFKAIIGQPLEFGDLRYIDEMLHSNLKFVLTSDDIEGLEFYFSVEERNHKGKIQEKELVEDGRNVLVTQDNKHEYVARYAEYRLKDSVHDQIEYFLNGVYDVIPSEYFSIFDTSTTSASSSSSSS
eukprot:gb/GECH01004402.1/.p1 GENE.gb/GECH01004402.1/~~gb/GECH01004402.1/.p1  ORF type:complete len:1021 (+),score=248.64 gb/GECH01004402.1/:1-3063(+)